MSNTIGTAYIQIEPTTKGISGTISSALSGEAISSGTSLGNKLSSAMGTAAKVGVTAIGATTLAMGAFGKSSLEAGAMFDASMSQVAATMGFSTDELNDATSEAAQSFQKLRDFAQQMGATTAFSATEASEALNYMALAGYDADTSMNMLPTVLNLAAAGSIDLASASDMVTDAQSALGLSLEDTKIMVDQMAAAASKSNTSVAQLGEAYLTVGANAKSLSGGTKELSTVLGLLADNGIKGAEGGTHLRNIMLAMNPTTDAAANAWEKLKVSAYDADGKLRPLQDTFADLNKAMEGMSDQQKSDLLTKMFNKTDLASVNALLATTSDRWDELGASIESASGLASLGEQKLTGLAEDLAFNFERLGGDSAKFTAEMMDYLTSEYDLSESVATQAIKMFNEQAKNGTVNIEALTQAFMNTKGAAQNMAEVQLDNLQGDVTLFKSALEGAKIALSDSVSPALREFVKIGTDGLTNITEGFKNGGIKGAMEAFGDSLGDIIDQVIEILPEAIDAAVTLLNSVIDALVENLPDILEKVLPALIEGCINLVINLVSHLPEIIWAIIKAIPTIIKAILDGFGGLGTALWDLCGGIWDGICSIFSGIGDFFGGLWDGACDLASSAWDSMSESASSTWDSIKHGWEVVGSWLGSAWDSLKGAASDLWDNVSESASSTWDSIQHGWEVAGDWLGSAWDSLKGTASDLWDNVSESASNTWDSIQHGWEVASNWLGDAWDSLKGTASDLWDSVEESASNTWDSIQHGWEVASDWLGDTWDSISEGASDMWDNVKESSGNTWDSIKHGWSVAGDWFSDTFSGAKDGIKNAWSGITDWFGGIWDKIKNVFGNAKDKFLDIGKNIIEGVKSGISNAWNKFKEWVGGLFSGLVDGVKSLFGIHSPSTVFRDEVGKWIPEGVAVGIEANMDSVEDSMDVMQSALDPNKLDVTQTYATNYDTSSGNESVLSLLNKYLPQLANMQMVTDTGAMVGVLAPKMDAELGRMATMRSRFV